jgi:hypothetical protein
MHIRHLEFKTYSWTHVLQINTSNTDSIFHENKYVIYETTSYVEQYEQWAMRFSPYHVLGFVNAQNGVRKTS